MSNPLHCNFQNEASHNRNEGDGTQNITNNAFVVTTVEATLAFDGINLAWCFKDQLEVLRTKQAYIQAFLDDASNSKHVNKSESLNHWLKRVRGVSYEADDVLDEYAIEMFRRKIELENIFDEFCNWFKPSSPVLFRFRMSLQASKILSNFNTLTKEARNIGIHTILDKKQKLLPMEETRPYGAASASEFIGREDDIEKLLQTLTDSSNADHRLTTIAIVGIGGLGKTSLAKRLYDHGEINDHFLKKSWICVSENFNITRIMNEVLESATSIKGDLSNMNAITSKIQTEWGGKKFLLVLDDVWEENITSWDNLKGLLEDIRGLPGSVLLITTRSGKVAEAARVAPTHYLNELSLEESWELFKLKLSASILYEDIGRRIVERCKGVPLSLIVIAGTLRSMSDYEEWEAVDNSELWEMPEGQNQILPSLFLSVNHLPYPFLKQCLAYCAIFPKDDIIMKLELVSLWLAQGFIRLTPIYGTSKMSMEEHGEYYLKVLLNSSLLQEVENRNDYVKMHDLVHDLAVYLSRDEVLLFKGGENQRENCDYRHLACITTHKTVSTPDFLNTTTLRKIRTIYGRIKSTNLLIHTSYLRSLGLHSSGLTEVPAAIGELKHLRFLDLSWNPIIVLPDFIGKLYQLHTLALQGCKELKELPAVLNKLVNLRNILTKTPVLASKGLANLKKLQTLPCLALNGEEKGWTLDELGDLHEIRGVISIYSLENVRDSESAKKAGLVRKNKVTKLILNWAKETPGNEETADNTKDEDVLDGLQPHSHISSLQLKNFRGERFPLWLMIMAVIPGEPGRDLKPLSNLTEVSLFDCCRCKTLPTLGHLPSLRSLILSGFMVECIDSMFYAYDDVVSHHESMSRAGNSGTLKAFEFLKVLKISGFPMLTTWTAPPREVVPTVFPCLEVLEVEMCPKLEAMFDVDLKSLKDLKLVGLDRMRCLDIIKVTASLTSLQAIGMPLVTSLPDELNNCSQLRTLSLILPFLRFIPSGLQSLQDLRIWSRALTSLPDDFFHCLSSLRTFAIILCPKLERIPSLEGCTTLECLILSSCELKEDVPAHQISKLHRLSELNIQCRSIQYLKSLLKAVQHLPQLRKLGIGGYKNEEEMREYFSDMTPFLRLPSLHHLILIGNPNMRYLPVLKLGLLTRLTSLNIVFFPQLEEIPLWICNITSLRYLAIHACESVRILPAKQDWQRLTRLLVLDIKACPRLVESCDKDRGSEWPKINHISVVDF